MNIIKDEREIKTIVACENCGKNKPGRTVEAVGQIGESRGHYKMCFDCFGPRIFWTDNRNGGIMSSPAPVKKKNTYTERHQLFPGKVIISYPFSWGGQMKDRWMWMAELNGDVLDYDAKASLIKDAEENGASYIVLRVHKDMTFDIVKESA